MPGETVTIACKLPHGLVLRLWQMVDVDQPVMGGGVRTVREARLDMDRGRVLIGGVAAPFGQVPASQVSYGYALTPNVDAEFWTEWLRQNATLDVVKNKLIFAIPKPVDIPAKTRELEDNKSGLEPLDPLNLPREFRKVETAKPGAA